MKILIAEDDPTSRRLLQITLAKWGYDIITCANGADAFEALKRENAPCLAVLDWMMPGMDGAEVCRRVRELGNEPYVYIILLTAKTQKEDVVDGMEAGADDYLTKPFNPQELRVRVRAGIRIIELQSNLIAAREDLLRQATHDPLTGLWNHTAIFDVLHREISRSRREDSPLCVLMLDVDHFKWFNDTYGHLKGDDVLRLIAAGMREVIREYDTLGRYGGEEFLIVLPSCNGAEGLRTAERLCGALAARHIDTPDGQAHVTVSIGVATNERDSSLGANVLIRAADIALYQAKDAGRNRAELANPENVTAETILDSTQSDCANN